MRCIWALLAIAATMLALDAVYLRVSWPRVSALVTAVQSGRPPVLRSWPAAAFVYAAMALGSLAAVSTANRLDKPLEKKTALDRALDGALRSGALGLVVYLVYNGTNFVAFDRWTLRASAIDTAWGTTLFAAAGAVAALSLR